MVLDRELIERFELYLNTGSKIRIESTRETKGKCLMKSAQQARMLIRETSRSTEIARMHDALFHCCLGGTDCFGDVDAASISVWLGVLKILSSRWRRMRRLSLQVFKMRFEFHHRFLPYLRNTRERHSNHF